MPDIFTYDDSRLFLKDYYEEQKKLRSFFSYRYFAEKAGLKSKTYIFKVINGEKALSKSAVFAVAQAMKLGRNETGYFEALVNFTQAKSGRERAFYFDRMQTFSGGHASQQLRQNQFDYLSKWYLPAIREIAAYLDFKDDFGLLAATLVPKITATQARKAVRQLCDLDLLKRSPDGQYVQTDTTLTTGNTIHTLAVQTFQKEHLRLATESIDRYKRHHRDISTLTVGVTEAGFRKIAGELSSFRKRLVELVENEKCADRVYQINFQIFPLSKFPEKG